MLREMKKVSNTVFETRLKEGGIDFDLSEAKVILDEHGDVAQMARRERTPSQRIIEECMLLANKGVAQLLGSAGYPLIYRVHDKPDPKKVAEFFGLIRSQGFTVKLKPGEASHKQIDGILSRFEGETRGRVFSYIAMRTMSRAYYSTQNIGHYGLGFPDYVHFTSPIRRYADLVIHRLIKIFIAKQKTVEGELVPETYGTLENAAVQISARERVAQTAEREIRTIKGIRFLSARKGETFKGMIVGVIKQGFFVELDDHAVEGFVPLLRLPKDRYEFLEVQLALKGQQRGKTYRIGDSVSIRVENADLATFQIEFSVTR
jgi:ribonuclease R